jgi:hypothetical protein
MCLRAGEEVAVNLQNEPVRVRVERVTPWAHTLSPDPIDVGPEEALREVLREFEDHAYSCYSATAWVRPGDGTGGRATGGRAIVLRRPRHVLHVIGTSKLAECFRELLREGVAGRVVRTGAGTTPEAGPHRHAGPLVDHRPDGPAWGYTLSDHA